MSSELVNYSTGVTVPSSWLNHAQLREQGLANYTIYQAGGVTYAKALLPSGIDYNDSGTPNPAGVIQNAINALSTGGKIFIRAGTYNIASILSLASTSNIRIQGEGPATVLKATSALARMVDIVSATYHVMTDMTLDGNSQAINGVDVSGAGASPTWHERLIMKNLTGIGYHNGGGSGMWLTDCFFTSVGTNAATKGAIDIDGGIARIKGCQATSCYEGLLVFASADVDVVGSYFGTSTLHGIFVSSANRCSITNCRVLSNTNNGIYATAPIQLQNSIIASNTVHGINIDVGADGSIITNNTIKLNNTGASGADGIRDTTNTGGNIIAGNRCSGASETQAYGIRQGGAATGTNNIIRNNYVSGNVSGSISYTTTPNYITDNYGFNPQSTASVTAGASPWTYTNNDNYNEIMVLNNLNGGTISAISYRGDTGYPTTVNGFSFLLEPNQTIIVTWATAAPSFKKYPL